MAPSRLDGDAPDLRSDVGHLIALAPKRLAPFVARYFAAESIANAASFAALFLMVPILRAVGGGRSTSVPYAFPWTPAGVEAFRLPWWAPFLATIVAAALVMAAKRFEFAVMRAAATAFERRATELLRGRDAGRSLIEAGANATGMAARWLVVVAKDALRSVAALGALVIFAPVAAPAVLLVSGVAVLALRVRATLAGRGAGEGVARRVDRTIDQRLRMVDAVSVFSLVAPITLLTLLVAERVGGIAAFDVVHLLFISALVAVIAGSVGAALHTTVLLESRPAKVRSLLAAVVRGDLHDAWRDARGRGADGGWLGEDAEEIG